MNKKDRIVLEKMMKYAKDSIKYIANCTYDEYMGDEKNLVFSIFCLSQMGELVSSVDKEIISSNNNIPWNELRGIRNRIVHDYDGIQYKIIWNILTKDISKLAMDIEEILKR